ncbi:MAG TPA: hypothetical protein VF482_01945 [Trebonia sp.]
MLDARLALARAGGDVAEARDVVSGFERLCGADHRSTLDARYELGRMLGPSEEAVTILRSVFETRTRVLPPGHPDVEASRAALERAAGAT